MPAKLRFLLVLLNLSLLVPLAWALPDGLEIHDAVQTHDDGRMPVQEVYAAYRELLEMGWQLDIIVESIPNGTATALPVIALRSPKPGPAAWFITGIHGEEPAGPNAMARAVDALAELGEIYPVVLLPLANPHGYARNWRYLNVAIYSEDVEGQSVGDSSHRLLADANPPVPRFPSAPNPEADAITRYVFSTARDYPPRYSIDLHEDNLIAEGYVYSQGAEGADDPLASDAVEILRQHDIAIKMSGQTRFGEDIVDGIIGPVTDSSLDELMSTRKAWLDGRVVDGPGAHTVLVFETPAGHVDIERRIQAHETLLRLIARRIAAAEN